MSRLLLPPPGGAGTMQATPLDLFQPIESPPAFSPIFMTCSMYFPTSPIFISHVISPSLHPTSPSQTGHLVRPTDVAAHRHQQWAQPVASPPPCSHANPFALPFTRLYGPIEQETAATMGNFQIGSEGRGFPLPPPGTPPDRYCAFPPRMNEQTSLIRDVPNERAQGIPSLGEASSVEEDEASSVEEDEASPVEGDEASPVKEDEESEDSSSAFPTPQVKIEDEESVHSSVNGGELAPAKLLLPRSTVMGVGDTLYSECATLDCNTLLSHEWDAESILCPVCTKVFNADLLKHFARVDEYPNHPVPDGKKLLKKLRLNCAAKAQLKGRRTDPYLGGGNKRTHYRFGKAHTAFLAMFFDKYSIRPTNSMYQYLIRKLNQIQPDHENITEARIRTWFKNTRFRKELKSRLPGNERRKRKKSTPRVTATPEPPAETGMQLSAQSCAVASRVQTQKEKQTKRRKDE